MGFFGLDAGILALVAGTIFFVLLGILVLLIGEIDVRKLFGILFVLVGLTLLFFAIQGEDMAVMLIAVILALIVNELLIRLGIVQ